MYAKTTNEIKYSGVQSGYQARGLSLSEYLSALRVTVEPSIGIDLKTTSQ